MAIGSGPKKGDRPDAARYLPKHDGRTHRQKGTQDTFSRTAKENVIAVFDHIGGIPAMATWAKKNRTEFYKLYARLIPVDVSLKDKRDASELTDSELAQIIAGAGCAGIDEAPEGEGIANGLH